MKVIADYIIAENTDFGILITGSWGSGKLYFLKNLLKNELHTIGLNDKNLIHISLFPPMLVLRNPH